MVKKSIITNHIILDDLFYLEVIQFLKSSIFSQRKGIQGSRLVVKWINKRLASIYTNIKWEKKKERRISHQKS